MTTRSRNCLRDVMSEKQEREFYEQVLEKVQERPRYYLDNLEFISTFRVSFLEYWEKRKIKSKGL